MGAEGLLLPRRHDCAKATTGEVACWTLCDCGTYTAQQLNQQGGCFLNAPYTSRHGFIRFIDRSGCWGQQMSLASAAVLNISHAKDSLLSGLCATYSCSMLQPMQSGHWAGPAQSQQTIWHNTNSRHRMAQLIFTTTYHMAQRKFNNQYGTCIDALLASLGNDAVLALLQELRPLFQLLFHIHS